MTIFKAAINSTEQKTKQLKVEKYPVDILRFKDYFGLELTYEEICSIQGWKVTNSNSRKAQFKALRDKVNYREIGSRKYRRYIIDSIKVGLDIEKIRSELSETKLINLVAKSILEQLYVEQVAECDEFNIQSSWFVTNRTLAKRVGLNSKSYDYVKYSRRDFANQYRLNLSEVEDTFKLNEDYVNTKIKQALNLLQNKLGIISHTQGYMLGVEQARVQDAGLFEEQGQQVAQTEVVTLYPSLSTIEWIKVTAIPLALRSIGVTSLASLNYDFELKKRFYTTVLPEWINTHSRDEIFKGLPKYTYEVQQLVGVKSVYCCHRIGFNTEVIQQCYEESEQLTTEEREILVQLFASIDCDKEEAIGDVSTSICNTLNSNLVTRHHKASQGHGKESTREIRSSETYVKAGKIVNAQCHSNKANYTRFGIGNTSTNATTKTVRVVH